MTTVSQGLTMNRLFWSTASAAVAIATAPVLAADAVIYTAPPSPAPSYSEPISAQSFAAHAEAAIGVVAADGQSEAVYALAGRANVPLTSNIGALVDVNLFGAFQQSDALIATATGHVWRRHDNAFYGVFGGAIFPPDGEETIGLVGVEGKYDFGQQLAGAQFAVLFADGETGYQAGLELDHYFTPNFKAGLNGQVSWGDDSDTAVWTLGGLVENRFAHLPVSAFASAQGTLFEDESAFTGFVGLRVFYDSPGSTLKSHDEAVPFGYSFLPLGG